MAELLASMGWFISYTPLTRDGGRDLLGIRQEAPYIETSWVIECKRYSPNRPVGIELVRSLYGLREQLRVSNAILVTTSHFSRAALELAQSLAVVHLIDHDKLASWLASYVPSGNARGYLDAGSFESCFISYSSRDSDFAEKLYSRLRESGVRVWFAPKDLLPGRKLHDEIKSAIGSLDRLLIVLSDQSITSEWVRTELRLARKREVTEGRRILFPVSLVPFETLRSWEFFDADTGKDIATEVREYLVLDFSRWHETDLFERAFADLLRGLRGG